jgi:hypothetical protein
MNMVISKKTRPHRSREHTVSQVSYIMEDMYALTDVDQRYSPCLEWLRSTSGSSSVEVFVCRHCRSWLWTFLRGDEEAELKNLVFSDVLDYPT